MENNNFITLITDSDLIFYYTNFRIEDGFLVIHGEDKFLYTDKRYYSSAMKTARATVRLIDTSSLEFLLDELNVKRVGILYPLTSVEFYEKLKALSVEIFNAYDLVIDKTSVKSLEEIHLIKNSCAVLEKSLKKALNSLTEGISENEFAGLIEYNFKLFGAEKPAFDTIVAFGEGTAVPHYKTGNVLLKKNMPVLIDCGCVVNGYNSDITRSFYYGNAPKNYKDAFSAVLNAHFLALNCISPNMLGKEADAISRNYLISKGYGEYFTHSLGHGVGVKVHEFPTLSPKSEFVLRNGNVFSIEPGVYFDNKFGIRIEDTVYLENGKVKSFFNLDKTGMGFNPSVN